MFFNRNKIPDYINDEKDLFRMDNEKEIINELTNEEIPKKKKISFNLNISKILTIVLIIILFLGTLSVVDIILVTKYNKKPFFAGEVKTYSDGTKEYLGWGYKVIDYSNDSRGDMVVGNWNLKYNPNTIKTSVIDLSLNYNNNFEKFINEYYDKYLEIEGEVSSINNNAIIVSDNKLDDKYKLNIICNSTNINYNINDTLIIKGVLNKYEDNNIYLNNCKINAINK